MSQLPTAQILYQTGTSGVSRVLRYVALTLIVTFSVFVPWALLLRWDEISTFDRMRAGLVMAIFVYCVLHVILSYVRFTESGIEQRSTFGRRRFYRYEDVEGFEVTIPGIDIYLRGGKKLTIKRFEADREKIEVILESCGVPRTNA